MHTTAMTTVTQAVWSSWLPSILFHSNNLQVCGSHTPNFNLSVMGDLLLKCLAINWSGILVASLTIHYTLTSRVCWVTDNFLSQALLPQMYFPWRVFFHQNTLNECYEFRRNIYKSFPKALACIEFGTGQLFSKHLVSGTLCKEGFYCRYLPN